MPSPKNILFGFCSLKENSIRGSILCIENIRNSFHHFLSMFGHRLSFVASITFNNNSHLQKYLELIFASIQKRICLDQTSRKTNSFIFNKKNCAIDTLTRLDDIDSRFCLELRLKNSFQHAKYTRSHYFRTEHVPNMLNEAIVIPTTCGACATHRKCSPLIQDNIGSCRRG